MSLGLALSFALYLASGSSSGLLPHLGASFPRAPIPFVAPPVESPDVDPRNWPTIPRLIADRFEDGGRVHTLRVYARKAAAFNCGYRGAEGRLKAFTLLGGPFETLTGYMPAELGTVLERILAADPWAPVTVDVSFNARRLSEICTDQVDVLKWSRGWQYPPETLSPARPDAGWQPTKDQLFALAQPQIWKDLTTGENPPIGQQIQIAGGARLANAFHCAFRGAWKTHWGLLLHDGRGRVIHAYVPKNEASRELVDQIALHRDVAVAIQARVRKQAMSDYCPVQLEVTSWSVIDQATAPPPRGP